jgi:hypothetical protein
MTRDQIDELMQENGIVVVGEAVYALVQLVIECEREECAKVCDEKEEVFQKYYTKGIPSLCAQAIRARGQA